MPERPADAGWLALRVPADNAAREAIIEPLLEPLLHFLRSAGSPVHVVDLGAGTGSNARWLAPRLSMAQRWTLIDHDARLLAQANPPVDFTAVAGRMDQLESLLAPRTAPGAKSATLITCSALLDVLTATDVESISAAVAAAGAAALFSLSVTGKVRLTPRNAFDPVITREFDNHQRRGGRLGPDAPEVTRSKLARHGLKVRSVETGWDLTSDDPALFGAWLHGRVEAAVEQAPERSEEAHRWLRRRLDQLARGELRARVEHVDLLALPAAVP